MFHVVAESAHWDSPVLLDFGISPLPVAVSAVQADHETTVFLAEQDVQESSLEETTQAVYDEGNVMMLSVAEL